ncbi:MAG: ribosomal protein L25/ral stress protein Ctc, partial [Cellulosimicrobium sp.]|nr:ribosomal protein L25/ral stress protein Ctc [Cellulosimicrobium sp.]
AVEAEATHLPESIEVSIEGLEAGSQILAGDVKLPQGTTLTADAELLVVSVTEPQAEATEDEAAEAAEEAPAEAAAE